MPRNAKNAIPQNADITGNAKNANPVISGNKDAGSLDNSGNAKNAHNLDLDIYPDTKDIDTKRIDTLNALDESTNTQTNSNYERMLLNNYAETKLSGDQPLDFLGSKILTYIAARTNTVKEADQMVDHILKAKRTAEKEYDYKIVIEYDLEKRQEVLFKTLARVFSNEKGGRVKTSILGYLFTAFKKEFVDMILEEESITKNAIYAGKHNPLADYRTKIPLIKITKEN